jgi:parallel beta-helix repeat protein/putative cofactor-binding repeat protein
MSYTWGTYLNQSGTTVSFNIPQTAAEVAASVTPTNFEFPQGDVRRYGAVLDGTTDDSAALQRWANVTGELTFPVAQTALIANPPIVLRSNTTITGCAGAVIQSANANASHFSGQAVSNVVVQQLKFYNTIATGTSALVAGVTFVNSSNCTVQNCEFHGMAWAGVFLSGSNFCTVADNYCHDWANPTLHDSNDIAVYGNSASNIVSNNLCIGKGWHGILEQDPSGSTLPIKNIYIGNRIGQHQAYGIAIYHQEVFDTYSQVIGNFIENILGSQLGNSSGAGIYVLGAGGVVIQGNTIRNCCQQTNNRTLAPAAIGVNGITQGSIAPVISGNSIGEMPAYDGIYVTVCSAGATISGNSINQPLANTSGVPIHSLNSSYVTIVGNQIANAGSGRNIMIEISSANIVQVAVANNSMTGGAYAAISVELTGGSGTLTGGQILGNGISGQLATSGNGGIFAPSGTLVNSVIANNSVQANTAPALTLGAPAGVMITGNVLGSTGTIAFTASGAGSASFLDKSNSMTSGVVNNSGTGMLVERLGSAAPSVGTWAIGDRTVQSVPVVGNPMAWRCTAAGSPGTWVSEGNLP